MNHGSYNYDRCEKQTKTPRSKICSDEPKKEITLKKKKKRDNSATEAREGRNVSKKGVKEHFVF